MVENPGQVIQADSSKYEHTAPAVEVQNIRKSFRRGRQRIEALQNVSLSVSCGTVTGLIGPDGAGKTTLMRLMSGLLCPDEGQIRVLGYDSTAQSLNVQSSIGYMPQRFGLYEDLTVTENLNLYADLQGVPRQARPLRFDELLRMTGLSSFPTRLAGKLSGGMKQKLGLACTLVRWPRLLLLDEPTVGVDPLSRRELWAIVYRLVKHEALTVILSTAYLDEAQRCHEVVLLHEGRLLGQGTPDSFSQKLHGCTYMASAPGLSKRRLQKQLAHVSGIVDTLVQADGVRLVAQETWLPKTESLRLTVPQLTIHPVQPRFEDSFVTLLRKEQLRHNADTPDDLAAGTRTNSQKPDVAVIQVRDVKRRFGNFYAVRGISFDVNKGEIFGLLGANGAGKSTTFRMLCGLLPVSAGSLSVAGVDLRVAPAAARARIGYMAQKYSLYGNLAVRENLRFFAATYGLAGNARSERIAWALEQFQLSEVVDTTSSELPLGYKQRLAMACSLMHEPDILFLDEPTSGVDPLARREFWQRINSLADKGVTVMITTHFMEEAEYCDRMAIMSEGRILAIGSPSEIRAMARTQTSPNPTMEEAFVNLIEVDQKQQSV